jgi:hypothetical protein
MTIVSRAYTASSTPDTARLAIQANPTSAGYALNTDLTAAVSRDGGTTWATTTLSQMGTPLEDGSVVYQDLSVNLSGQPSGTSMRYRIIAQNSKPITIYGVVLQWGSLTALSASNFSVTGSLASTGLTSGSLVFSGSGGVLSQDNANLFYDATNHRLGLGTTTPSAALTVTSLAQAGTLPLFSIASSTGSNLFTVTGAGNVGIGTASPDSGALLEINQPTSQYAELEITSRAVNSGTGILRFRTKDASGAAQGASIWSDGTGLLFNTSANISSSQMVLTNAGNVGIGTTTPTGLLSIAGASGSGLVIQNYPSSNHMEILNTGNTSTNGGTFFVNSYAQSFVWQAGGSERMRIDGSGNVLVGESSSIWSGSGRGTLEVNGASTAILGLNINGGNGGYLYNNGSSLILKNYLGNVQIVSTGGTCTYASGTSWSCSSDERLKSDVASIGGTDALAAIDRLHPVSYVMNADPSKQHLGFLAQEVGQVFPQAVTFDPTVTSTSTPDGTYLLDYTSLIAPAVAAIQQLDTRTSFISASTSASSLTVDAVGNIGVKGAPTNAALTVSGDASVSGTIYANGFTVPASSYAATTAKVGFGTTTLPSILAATSTLDIYKLAVYNLGSNTALAARVSADEVRMDSLESRIAKLESGAVGMATSSPVSFSTSTLTDALQSLGAKIEDGLLAVRSLSATRFIAATDASGESSAGQGVVLAGNTAALVENTAAMSSSKIFVTFTSPLEGNWYLSDKQAGSFRLMLDEAQTADVTFDYFIVETATSTDDGGEGTATSSDSSDDVTHTNTITVITTDPNGATSSTTTTVGSTGTTTDSGADTVATSTDNGIDDGGGTATTTESDTDTGTATSTDPGTTPPADGGTDSSAGSTATTTQP